MWTFVISLFTRYAPKLMPYVSKVAPFFGGMSGMAIKGLVVAIAVTAIHYNGHRIGSLETRAEIAQELLADNQSGEKVRLDLIRAGHKKELDSLAESIVRKISNQQASEVRRETIRELTNPDKDVYCRPDDRIVRLLERARAGDNRVLRVAPDAPAGDRATPESFSYADFIVSYEELVTRFNTLRAEKNDLATWNLTHAPTDTNSAGVREALE